MTAGWGCVVAVVWGRWTGHPAQAGRVREACCFHSSSGSKVTFPVGSSNWHGSMMSLVQRRRLAGAIEATWQAVLSERTEAEPSLFDIGVAVEVHRRIQAWVDGN